MRIHQNSVFLSQLVREVSRGVMVPASFQRPYVWGEADVMALCRSVVAGFPLGGFLTWEPGKKADITKAGRRRLGPIAGTAGTAQKLLLDGQNRLATIAWMLRDSSMAMPEDLSQAERSTWDNGKTLVVDLAAKAIRFVPSQEADQGFTMPSRSLLRSPDTNNVIRKRWDNQWKSVSEADKDAGLKWWDRIVDTFCDARVVETVLENASVEEAKEAFLHICKVGVPMSEEDFDKAVSWAL